MPEVVVHYSASLFIDETEMPLIFVLNIGKEISSRKIRKAYGIRRKYANIQD